MATIQWPSQATALRANRGWLYIVRKVGATEKRRVFEKEIIRGAKNFYSGTTKKRFK